MPDTTNLGDRMKQYERQMDFAAMKGLPLLARIDGRAFHTFTKGMDRPFDARMSRLMVDTTIHLVDSFAALAGFTQSDEISLLWYDPEPNSELPFAGRLMKLSSVLASSAAAFFNKEMPYHFPSLRDRLPCFDCRVWNVPDPDIAVLYFIWRERDATKNSISMAAQSMFSHKELQNKHSGDMQEMLFQKGVNWNDYPAFFKRGTFVKRVAYKGKLSPEELATLPEKHHARTNPDLEIVRSKVQAVETPPFDKVLNKEGFLFRSEQPQTSVVLPGTCNIQIVEAGVDPNHQTDHCDHCKRVFDQSDPDDEAIATCDATSHLTLCRSCYDKAGNSVR